MKKHCSDKIKYRIVAAIMAAVFVLAGCSSQYGAQQNQTAGEEDVPLSNILTRDVVETSIMKTSTKVDLDSAPDDIMDMVKLCDSLNIAFVEGANRYSANDAEFVWNAVRLAMMEADIDEDSDDIRIVSDSIVVKEDVVEDYAYAMFGKLKSLPPIPETMIELDNSSRSAVTFADDHSYSFLMGDRGLCKSVVKNITQYSDASVEIGVMLCDMLDDSEMASFIYTMRSNTRDISTAARFAYEITNVRSADKLTSDRMQGVPYVVMLKQFYPDKTSEGASMDIEEVPYFSTYGPAGAEVEKLNNKIRDKFFDYGQKAEIEITDSDDETDDAEADSDEESEADADDKADESDEEIDEVIEDISWHEILAYPVTTNYYVQVLMHYNDYPCYATMGDVVSYNYSIREGSVAELSNALTLGGYDNVGALEDEVLQSYNNGQYDNEILNMVYQGFIVLEDESVDYYFKIYFAGINGAENYDGIASYNNMTKKLTLYEASEDLVAKEHVDEIYPPLTHGR